MSERLGFIGLGQMGGPMTRNLLRAGHAVAVRDVAPEKERALAADGAAVAPTPREVAAAADIVLACLPNGDIVDEVAGGPDGLLAGWAPGKVFVDLTTNYPARSARLAARFSEASGAMLDAPISGGEPRAIEGSLSIMAGGPREAYERCLPVLQVVGGHVALMGEAVGAGGHAKLANQILVCIHLGAVAEALAYAERAGLELAALIPALTAGMAHSAILEWKAPKILARDWSTVGPTWMSYKDLGYIEQAMAEFGFSFPLTHTVHALYKRLMDAGKGDTDQMILLELYEEMAGIER